MAENTKIEWAHHTFNPWIGCTKVGPGCEHCYAEVMMDKRYGRARWGAGQPRVRTSEANWNLPRAWDRKAAATGIRYRVFCASLADVFDNEVDPQWRDDLWRLILDTPHLDWLLLTKRIGNVACRTPIMGMPENVWLGATIVNQAEADRDIPKLLATPAAKRFLSMEPLLGPVDLLNVFGENVLNPECWGDCACDSFAGFDPGCRRHGGDGTLTRKLDWIIVGGESGANARPMHPDWARSLRDQCAAAGVPFLFKQWGEWLSGTQYNEACILADPDLEQSRFDCMDWDGERFEESGGGWMDDLDENAVFRVGKKRAGRLLDGVQYDGVPA